MIGHKKNKVKKKMSRFYKIYFSVLTFLLLALAAGAVVLSRVISDYNRGIPETVSKEFFNTHFASPDDYSLSELCGEISEFEYPETVFTRLREFLASDTLSYVSISSGADAKEGQKDYIVKSGETKIASFTLMPDEKNDYHVSSVRLSVPTVPKLKFRIFDGSKLYVGTKEVPDSYIVASEKTRLSELIPKGAFGGTINTYEISGLRYVPDVFVMNANGDAFGLSPDENGVYNEPVMYDEPEEELVSFIISGAEQYAKCMQSDAAKGTVYPYFEEGSALRENIRSAENMFVWDHDGYSFEDVKATEFRRYDENTVSCRVSFTHILHKYGLNDYRDYFDITYFARKGADGSYRIYASMNN